MSPFTEFSKKSDWCKCSLNNKIKESDEGDNYLSGWDDNTMNGACLMLNNKFTTNV